jgi:glycosidase
VTRRTPLIFVALLLLSAGSAFAQTATETAGFTSFEAENFATFVSHGSSTAWSTGSSVAGFSGTGYVEALPNVGLTIDNDWTTTSPELQYTVNFSTPGTYYVWVRGYANVNTDASFHTGLDGVSDSAARMTLTQFNSWQWSNAVLSSAAPAVISVGAAGNHTFSIWMRDDGVRIDQVILTTNPNYTPEATANFWQNQSIYQIVTDRFFNGDSTNDNADGNFNATSGTGVHGGDFKGIEQKLDYIKALGATAIWISPVVLNANGEYHGYAGRDFYKVDPHWGTLADLAHMVQEAHKRGLLVIDDIVANHGGDLIDSGDSGYPNFIAPPSGYNLRFKNSSKQYPTPFDINATNPTISSLFHNNGAIQNFGDNTQVVYGELDSLDDFRTESAYVQTSMAAIYEFWVEQAHFDAFRIDTVKHVDNGFWQSWCPALHQEGVGLGNPNFFMFGEVYDGSDAKCGSYTGTESGGAFELDSVLDYPLYFLINSVFANASGNTQQIENRYNAIAANYDPASQMQLVTFLDNHDQPRFMNTSGANTSRLNVALTFLYTARGIPSLYYGTEQAFDGGADPNNREDMFDGQFEQGTSLGDNFNMASPQFQLVAKLNNFRRLYPALRTGVHVNQWNDANGPGLFAYSRQLGTQDAFVVLNTSTSTQSLPSRNTIYPAGTVVANLLNPTETLTVTSAQQFPAVSMPGTSAKIFVAQSLLQPLDPVLTNVTPAHDALGIGTASSITLVFSKSMDTASVQSAFSTSPATTGTFAWSASVLPNDTMMFTPAATGLAANTLYTVTIASTAADTGGKVFFAPFQSRFTTGSSAVQTARPAATTNAATNLAQTSATLNAAVNPNGGTTTVQFQYGRTSNYGSTTSTQNIGSGTNPVPVSASITGLTRGRTYHFRISATNSVGTTLGADQTFVTPNSSQVPTATTNTASSVTVNSATLNGTVNPAGQTTTVQFNYGVAPNALTSSTGVQSIGSGTSNVAVNISLTGLSANTTYYFMVAAVSGIDPNTTTTTGSILTFTTAPVTPSVTTSAATSLATTSATLNGTVNPNGSSTSANFEYGLTSSYGGTSAAQNAGAGTSPVALSTGLTNLLPGATYHYRLDATNPNGSALGVDQTFTTLFPPPEVATTSASAVALNAGTINGMVDPNGASSSAWFEYGLTNSYGSTTRQFASDNAETYSGFGYATNNNGGSGFGPITFLEGTGGGLYLASPSAGNRQIDGNNSFGVYAGTGGQAACRALLNPRAAGTLTLSVRFDLSNAAAFSGFSIKSAQGTSFAANELLSFGLNPSTGNTTLFVAGSVNQTIPLGAEIRGAVVDLKVDYDCSLGTYTLGAKFRASPAYVSVSGNLKATGVNAAFVGFANFNNNGTNQNLIFDTLSWAASDSVGAGNSPIPINFALNNLTAHTTYHYRAVALNASGATDGADMTFVTRTPVEQWRQANFGTIDPNDPVAGNNADPDHDGIINLLEYAFGMNPNAADPSLAPAVGRTAVSGTQYLTITFRQLHSANGITYTVQESPDLAAWSPIDPNANLVSGPIDQFDGTDLYTIRGNIPLTSPSAFLRLQITVP